MKLKGWQARTYSALQRFETQLRRFMRSRAERHAGIHFDTEAAGRRCILAPFGNQKEALANTHGFELGASLGNPVARFFLFEPGGPGRKVMLQIGSLAVFIEECAQYARTNGRIGFRDPERPAIPQLGNKLVLFLLPAVQIQREHGSE